MTQATLLDGSAAGDAAGRDLRAILTAELEDAGFTAVAFTLREERIAYCQGCFACWVKTPGVCVLDDAGRQVARCLARSDLAALLTPLTFGGYGAWLKSALDRAIPNISPRFTVIGGETHHQRRYRQNPRLVAVALADGPDAGSEAVFSRLVAGNALNFHSPGHAACVCYRDEGPAAMRAKVKSALRQAGVSA